MLITSLSFINLFYFIAFYYLCYITQIITFYFVIFLFSYFIYKWDLYLFKLVQCGCQIGTKLNPLLSNSYYSTQNKTHHKLHAIMIDT